MRKFLLPIMISVLCFGLISCNQSWKSKVAEAVAGVAAPLIAEVASCEAVDEIQSDMEERILELPWLKKSKVRKALVNKGIGSLLCVSVVSAIVPMIVDVAAGELPPKYKCSGDLASTTLSALAKAACSTLQI